jgi:3',5'-cyclic AMP phosphodiesterase CpdA
MPFTRRRFLALGGLTGLGLTLLGRELLASRPGKDLPQAGSAKKPLSIPADAVILRFAATADTGAADANQRAIGTAMAAYHDKNPYNLVVMAGDNIYTQGEMSKIGEAFERPYAELLKRGVKFRACLGNHDIRTENGDPQVKYPGFNMDGRNYTYRAENAQFFVLDTNVHDWKPQLTWLEQQLKDSQAKLKIVYGHHPVYSSGFYGTSDSMVARLTPLFKRYGVQLYLNGHEHSYERTNPIEGTTFLNTGHGGASLRGVDSTEITAFSISTHGFSAVEIRPHAMVIQGFDKTGKGFDRGVIAIA